MPRKPRKKSATEMYHIMVHGIDKLPIFQETREKTRILNLIRENSEEYEVQIYAYCIMSNHFHMLIKARLEKLASYMAKISANYAFYFNYKHNRTGYVFRSRYHSQCVEKEDYYWNCLRYIHMNPADANICQDMTKYRHSSIHEYINQEKSEYRILHRNAFTLLKIRFSKQQELFEFHKLSCKEVFVDTKNEELLQKMKIAKIILREIQQELKISFLEIFDYVKLRNLLDKEIMETMNLSKKETRYIRECLKDELKTI